MDDLSPVLDPYLESQTAKQKSSVQDASADRGNVRLMCWKARYQQGDFSSLVLCALPVSNLSPSGAVARELSLHRSVSSVRAVVCATPGTRLFYDTWSLNL